MIELCLFLNIFEKRRKSQTFAAKEAKTGGIIFGKKRMRLKKSLGFLTKNKKISKNYCILDIFVLKYTYTPILNMRPVGQAVKTLASHAGNMGSIPVRVTIKDKSELLCHRQSVRICFLFQYWQMKRGYASLLILSGDSAFAASFTLAKTNLTA